MSAPARSPLPPPPSPGAPPSLAGFRTDPYAASLELVVAAALLAYGAFELREALLTTNLVLGDSKPYQVSDTRMIVDVHARAALHYAPGLALSIAALFVRRRDPYTRPLVAALVAVALGGAHLNAVMSFYGAALAPVGTLAILFALRPNAVLAFVAASASTLLLAYAAVRMDAALRHVLLGFARKTPTALDAGAAAGSAGAWLAGAALAGAALTWRRSAPGRAIRLRLVVVTAWGLPFSVGTYALLHRFGLPLDA